MARHDPVQALADEAAMVMRELRAATVRVREHLDGYAAASERVEEAAADGDGAPGERK